MTFRAMAGTLVRRIGRRKLARAVGAVACGVVACGVVASGALVASTARAQGAVLVGSVRDDLGQPVVGAQIFVHGNSATAKTDADGRFRVQGVPYGLTYVAARGPGLLPAVELLRLAPNDSLDFVLDRVNEGTDGARIRSVEQSYLRDLKRFAWATDAARTGLALTDRDIAQRAPAVLTDLLRGVNGFKVVGIGYTARVQSSTNRCEPTVFIDDAEQVNLNINDVRPSSLKLLLAFDSYAVLPPALRSLRTNASCGVISMTSF